MDNNGSYARLMGGRRGTFADEPYWNVVDTAVQAAKQRALIDKGLTKGNDVIIGEMLANIIHPDGGLNSLSFPEQRRGDRPIIREMIDTAQGQMALLEKVRVDVAFGLADIPLLYGPIYRRIAPAGGFPGGTFQIDENTLTTTVIFTQKYEGGEVQFGTLSKGAPSVGIIATYASGFEWTEDMIEFDRTWQIEDANRAFGRAYNALLNHNHLSPIIGASYGGDNSTPADATVGASLAERTHRTFQSAYTTSVLPPTGPRRTGTVLLASEANRFQIEQALLTPVTDESGMVLPNVPVTTIIYYDGESITVGSDTYTYPGVTPGTCFLIFPQRKLLEMVHHDLRIDVGPPDISRLVEGQSVGRARRGIYANLNESVEKITLPT